MLPENLKKATEILKSPNFRNCFSWNNSHDPKPRKSVTWPLLQESITLALPSRQQRSCDRVTCNSFCYLLKTLGIWVKFEDRSALRTEEFLIGRHKLWWSELFIALLCRMIPLLHASGNTCLLEPDQDHQAIRSSFHKLWAPSHSKSAWSQSLMLHPGSANTQILSTPLILKHLLYS